MKGFFQYLAPFAPDYSGAAAVLYEMGGLVVLCDPGGCSGNVCGYDEPRFYGGSGALLSAALRDMDAILGKDDALKRKVLQAAAERDYAFTALIGTPVSSVIGMDLRALCRGIERETGRPALAVDTDGMDLYDRGQSKAYLQLARQLGAAGESAADAVGVLGATPLDTLGLLTPERARAHYGPGAFLYGDPGTVARLGNLKGVARNVVLSPSGLAAAREMEEKYGIGYTADFPNCAAFDRAAEALEGVKGARILILHQQMAADALRRRLEAEGHAPATVGTWFLLDAECARDGDLSFADEEDFIAKAGAFDAVVADPLYQKALAGFAGKFVPLPHFAVSGDLFG
jgi:hypothetical protein